MKHLSLLLLLIYTSATTQATSSNKATASHSFPTFYYDDFMAPGAAITIVSTSEASTSDVEDGSAGNERPVAIGEVITYRLLMLLPESTTISFSQEDVLPDGLEYVAGSARVSYTANTLPSFNGDFAGIMNEMTPSFAFPASRINFDGGTRTLSFDFDAIINNDGDADDEFIILEFDVVVIDDPVNSDGQIWNNSFNLIIDEGLPTEVTIASEEVGVVIVEPALTIAKSFSPDAQVRGGTTTLTLEVRNLAANGATAAIFDLQVTDILDDLLNVTNISVSFNATATTFGSSYTDNSIINAGFATGVTDNMDIAVSGLPVDGVATITITLQIDPSADPLLLSRTITNTVDVNGDGLESDAVPDDEDRVYSTSAMDDLNVVKPTLLVTKTDDTDPVAAGASMSYTISIQNTGTPNFNATNVILTDVIPAGFVVSQTTPSQGMACTTLAGTITCPLGTIASGANASVTIMGAYPASTVSGTVVNNIAYITSTEGNHGNDGNDTPTDNDDERAEEPTTILRQIDLEVTTSESIDPAVAGTLTYIVTIQNNGPSDASNVNVSEVFTLPAGVTIQSITPSQGSYAMGTWTIVNLPANGSATLTIVLDIDLTAAPGTDVIALQSTAIATESESNIMNNDSEIATSISVTGTIKVIKEAQTADDTPFTFSNPTTGFFMLSNPSTPMQAFTDLLRGSYVFTEAAVAGWRMKNVIISGDTDNGSTTDISNRNFTVDLDAEEDITVTVYNCQLPTFSGVSVSAVCVGAQATITLSGLNVTTALEITYTIGNSAPQTVTLTSDANGSITFLTNALTEADHGLLLTITQLDFAEDANSCVNDNLVNNTTNLVVNIINAGVIGINQTVCSTKDPAPFITSTPAMSTGTITYQWESSIISCDSDFNPIVNATQENFDPAQGQFLVTTYFRRRAISNINGTTCEALSNCVTLTILNVDCGQFPWSGNE